MFTSLHAKVNIQKKKTEKKRKHNKSFAFDLPIRQQHQQPKKLGKKEALRFILFLFTAPLCTLHGSVA